MQGAVRPALRVQVVASRRGRPTRAVVRRWRRRILRGLLDEGTDGPCLLSRARVTVSSARAATAAGEGRSRRGSASPIRTAWTISSPRTTATARSHRARSPLCRATCAAKPASTGSAARSSACQRHRREPRSAFRRRRAARACGARAHAAPGVRAPRRRKGVRAIVLPLRACVHSRRRARAAGSDVVLLRVLRSAKDSLGRPPDWALRFEMAGA